MFLSRAQRLYVMVIFHLCGVSVRSVLSEHPGDREDAMQRVTLHNAEQCRRLCLYRRLCSSYSFRAEEGGSSSSPPEDNCVLHAGAGDTGGGGGSSPTGWVEKSSSSLHVKNGCSSQPCAETEVCVPTTSTSASYACLPYPSQCGVPKPVPNGIITTNGTSQNDAAHVTCNEQFVASPKGVSQNMTCLVTSSWTEFEGACKQYEFVKNPGSETNVSLPWTLNETGGKFCIKGVFSRNGQMRLDFYMPHAIFLHVGFRHKFVSFPYDGALWNLAVNDKFAQPEHNVKLQPLQPVTNFTMDIQLLEDRLQLTLNDDYIYNITLKEVTSINKNAILWQTEDVHFGGAGTATYVNLLKGC